MQGREEYIKLKEYAAANNFSAADVRNMTKQQAATVIGLAPDAGLWSRGNEGFFTNLKENVAMEIEIDKFDTDYGLIEAAVKRLFPQMGCIVNKRQRVITMFLDGLSEIEEI